MRFPGLRRRREDGSAPAQPAQSAPQAPETAQQRAEAPTQWAPGAATEKAPAQGAPGAATEKPDKPRPRPAPPTVEERLEGVRSWVAQLDRKLSIRTYAGAAALVLAIAAAAVALVLLLQLREDAATDDDVARLSEQISGVEDTATQAAQEDVQSVVDTVSRMEQQISDLESERDSTNREISVLQDDIQDLRTQISGLNQGSAGAGSVGAGTGAGAGAFPTGPGASGGTQP
jgi:hypothetical protein